MKDIQRGKELTIHIMLETRQKWVACSVGGDGLLVCARVGKHASMDKESEKIALAFVQRVLQVSTATSDRAALSLPHVLVEEAEKAEAVMTDPEHVGLLCTSWRLLAQTVEICSVGYTSVLVFEQEATRRVLAPQTVNEQLRKDGRTPSPLQRHAVVAVLGSSHYAFSCRADEVPLARIPLLPTTTIAIIEEPLLAEALLERDVPASALSSFIEQWRHPLSKKTARTSVLLSLSTRPIA